MILLILGSPGSGKGTQSQLLAGRLGIPAISTGDLLRAECRGNTELGRVAGTILPSGGLVSDEIVNRMVAGRIEHLDCARGFLLDGYPRTVPQAQAFAVLASDRRLPDPVVVHLEVSETALLERLTARWLCPRCKHIYNLISQPPRTGGRCDHDGAKLVVRDDDQEQVIRQRLRAYEDQTLPILQYYGAGMVHRVDGAAAPAQVTRAIERAVLTACLTVPDLSASGFTRPAARRSGEVHSSEI